MTRLGIVITVITVAFGLSSMAATSEKTAQRDGKIRILFRDFETPTTRAGLGKFLDVKKASVPYEPSTLTEKDRASLDPDSQGDIRRLEALDRMAEKKAARDEVKRKNDEKEKDVKRLRESMVGSDAGRNIVQAKDWLSEAMSPYLKLIEIVDRADMDEAQNETANSGGKQGDIGGVTHILKAVVGDTQERVTKTESYGAEIVRVVRKLNVQITLLDLKNTVVFAKSFDGEQSDVHTSFGNTTGADYHEEMLRDALKKAGEAIGQYFSAPLSITLKGPTGVEDFEPSAATIYVDGVQVQPDDQVMLLKGMHKVSAEMDGYEMSEMTFDITAPLKKTIVMRSAFAFVQFKVVGATPTPDISAASFELVGTGGAETFQGEGPHRVKKGKYSLQVMIEGFSQTKMTLNVASGNEQKPQLVTIKLVPNNTAPNN